MHDARAFARRQHRQRARHDFVQRGRTEAAADDQHVQRAAARCIACFGRFRARKFRANRVARPFRVRQRTGERDEYAFRDFREHLVRQARDRILVMQHERAPRQRGHHARRERDVAAHPEYDVGPHAAQRGKALTACAQQVERQRQLGLQALAAQPAEAHVFHRNAVLRHERRFHPGRIAEPYDAPARRFHPVRDREPREHVAPGAACHHHQRALRRGHTFPPRISTRFS